MIVPEITPPLQLFNRAVGCGGVSNIVNLRRVTLHTVRSEKITILSMCPALVAD